MSWIVTERRIVRQDWYETELTKTGWDSHGWYFADDAAIKDSDWAVVDYSVDIHGNPYVGIAEKESSVDM